MHSSCPMKYLSVESSVENEVHCCFHVEDGPWTIHYYVVRENPAKPP